MARSSRKNTKEQPTGRIAKVLAESVLMSRIVGRLAQGDHKATNFALLVVLFVTLFVDYVIWGSSSLGSAISVILPFAVVIFGSLVAAFYSKKELQRFIFSYFGKNVTSLILVVTTLVAIIPLVRHIIPKPTPLYGSVAVTEGDKREVLVLVAKFDQISGNPLEPDREWEIVLNRAMAQLGDQVNVRVLRIPQIIRDSSTARQLSDNYQATLIIWGRVRAAELESVYTVTPRWGYIDVEPANTRISGTIDELSLFVSPGGDAEYALNFVLAQLNYFSENPQNALPFLDRAIELAPEERRADLAVGAMYFYRANLAGYGEDIEVSCELVDRVLSDYDQAIAFLSNPVGPYINRGIRYSELGNYAQALADFDRAIFLNPNSDSAYANRAMLYTEMGDMAQALADFNQVVAINPSSADAYVGRGILRGALGEITPALNDFDQAIALDPNLANAYNNRGRVFITIGDNTKALANFDQAIALDPNLADAYNNRGRLYATIGDTASALADFDRAIALDPNLADAYNNRGRLYATIGDRIGALADYDQAISLDPNVAIAFNNRGALYLELGENSKALVDLDRAIALDSNLAMAYNNRGAVYGELGENAQALTDLDRAIVLDPDMPDAYNNRGSVHVSLRLNVQAMADYDRAIALNPNLAMGYNNRGNLHIILGENTQALTDLNRAIALDPNLALAYYNRGSLYLKLGNDIQAEADFDRAMGLDPDFIGAD